MNKNFNKYLILTTIVFLSNCGKKNIKKDITIIRPPAEISQYYEEKDCIKLTTRKLCLNQLNKLTSRKVFKEFQPIELHIKNTGTEECYLLAENISLELAHPKKIIRLLSKKVLYAILWPPASVTPTKFHVNLCLSTITQPLIAYVSSIFFIWGVVGATMSNFAFTNYDNQRLRGRIKNNTLDSYEPLIINPKQAITTIIFVEKEKFKENFEINILNIANNQKTNFKVNLEN